MTNLQEKLDRIEELLNQKKEIDQELAEILGEPYDAPISSTKQNVSVKTKKSHEKKPRKCSVCDQFGHRMDHCPEKPAAFGHNKEKYKKEHEETEEDADIDLSVAEPKEKVSSSEMAEKIRTCWVDQNNSSLTCCEELSISLSTFNHIIQKHGIVKSL